MFKDSLKTIALSLIILSLMGVVYAWTEPTDTPPNSNTAAPITVNNSTQVKSGALGIQGTLVGYADGYVVNKMGIGELNVDSDLKLDVAGKVGATEYCDEYGTNCIAAGELGEDTADLRLEGYVNKNFNIDEDIYTEWDSATYAAKTDTCNNNNITVYSCSPNDSKIN